MTTQPVTSPGSIAADIAAHGHGQTDREGFIPTRWPHTYAYDYARQHPAVVGLPDDTMARCSRSQMSGEVKAYAERTGQDPTTVKQTLALAYLAKWNVDVDPTTLPGLLPDLHPSASPDGEEQRLVVVLNSNAKVSRGKAAAQAVHAALTLLGVHPGTPVIVLGGKPADIEAMPVQIRDAGRTEVEPGTLTAGAEWRAAPPAPPEEEWTCTATVPGTDLWRCMLPQHDESVQHDDGRGKRW